MTPTPNDKARLYKKDTSQKDYTIQICIKFDLPPTYLHFIQFFIATTPFFWGVFIYMIYPPISNQCFPPHQSIRGTNSESVRPRYGVEVVVVDTSETFPSSEVTLLSGSGVVVTSWNPMVTRFKVQGSSRPVGISEYGSHVIGFPKKKWSVPPGTYINVKTQNEYWTNGNPHHIRKTTRTSVGYLGNQSALAGLGRNIKVCYY